jgi:hypothetical protein
MEFLPDTFMKHGQSAWARKLTTWAEGELSLGPQTIQTVLMIPRSWWSFCHMFLQCPYFSNTFCQIVGEKKGLCWVEAREQRAQAHLCWSGSQHPCGATTARAKRARHPDILSDYSDLNACMCLQLAAGATWTLTWNEDPLVKPNILSAERKDGWGDAVHVTVSQFLEAQFSITTTVSFAFSFKDVLVWCAPSTRSGISAVSDAVLGVLVNQMKACIGL